MMGLRCKSQERSLRTEAEEALAKAERTDEVASRHLSEARKLGRALGQINHRNHYAESVDHAYGGYPWNR